MQQIDTLIQAIQARRNPSALGLDTRYEYIPPQFAQQYASPVESILAYNKMLLQGLADIIPCVKVQAAYYELLGVPGMDCMAKTIEHARNLGFVVIVDAKRGDIAATALAYAQAFLAENAPFAGDFLTVNPYFGSDGIVPFLETCHTTGRGIFVLLKTSNPSSGEIQDILAHDGRPLYQHVADKVAQWGGRVNWRVRVQFCCSRCGGNVPCAKQRVAGAIATYVFSGAWLRSARRYGKRPGGLF